LPRLRLEHGDTVEEVLVRPRSSPVDAGQHGVRRQGDAWHHRRQHDEEAAVQRQSHDLLVLDHGPEARACGAHDRPIADDCHDFLQASNGELDIEPRLFTGGQGNALAAYRFEPREIDLKAVDARRQTGDRICPLGTRDCFASGGGVDPDGDDRRSRHRTSSRVGDHARNLSTTNLRRCDWDHSAERERDRQHQVLEPLHDERPELYVGCNRGSNRL
jgi:hypothetical protein